MKLSTLTISSLLVFFALFSLQASELQERWTPVKFSISDHLDYPKFQNINGLRFSLWTLQSEDNINGLDLGIFSSAEKLNGLQLGMASMAVETTGIQLGILAAASSIRGAQIGGVCLTTAEGEEPGIKGLQIGIANFSERSYGAQIGILDISSVEKGFQLGMINMNAPKNKESISYFLQSQRNNDQEAAIRSSLVQIGLINYSKIPVKGFQVGLINLANSLKGFQLGIINYVKSPRLLPAVMPIFNASW
jgi:hypothetical protein